MESPRPSYFNKLVTKDKMYDRRDKGFPSADDPPHSRIFIVAPKSLSEDDFRKPFEQFGNIEELWVVRDKNTGDRKGVAYIKYSKTSEAAKAIENMNLRSIGGGNSIKVKVAASREQGSKKDIDEESLKRLFVLVPKTMDDSELYDYFKQYGEIDYASVIKDKSTRESKGFAFVKFNKFSSAAKAFENCDRKYRPVFAEPKKSREEREMPVPFGSFSSSRNINPAAALMPPSNSFHDEGYTKLAVIASPLVNQDQMWKLFDIVPTMDYCNVQFEGDRMRPVRAICEVAYGSSQWAAYAKQKFHGFEYPAGYRLIVKPEYSNFSRRGGDSDAPDLLKIAETIAQASSLIQAAGLSPEILHTKLGITGRDSKRSDFCSVRLPDPLPLASLNDEMKARCFIICSSHIPNSVLKDVFCRFGDLIEVYLLPNRNCGYAKFASEGAAREAMETLHGAEICGVRIKVVEAEDRVDRKRQRLGDNDDDDDIRMD